MFRFYKWVQYTHFFIYILMIDKIREIIEPILEKRKVELVDTIYRMEGARQVLRILVDREGGITLAECAELNEVISRVLDESDVITTRYILEVYSPGIDRPFKVKKDYEKAKNRLVRVTLNEPILEKKEYIGRLEEVSGYSIKINTKKKGVIEIPFEKITRTRQEVEF